MTKHLYDILIPTYNNPEYLNPCITSILNNNLLDGFGRIVIINNGSQPCEKTFKHYRDKIEVLTSGENLGWTKGLAYGLERSSTDFVCFLNDDTFIPRAMHDLFHKLLIPFSDPDIAAVGPTTTVSAGMQSIYHPQTPMGLQQVSFLIFFCVMLRRADIDKVGGLDTTLCGGDDFDMSIKFMKAKKKMVINPEAFLIHHAFKTGHRVKGTPDVKGGWNSKEMIDSVNRDLINRHGFKNFFSVMCGLDYDCEQDPRYDLEREAIKDFVGNAEKVVELGCGGRKVTDSCIGVDIVKKGEKIPYANNITSVADIQADVSKTLPIESESCDVIVASHVLEHCLDTVSTLTEWMRILKKDGRMVVAVPDQDKVNGIPMNPEHVHGFNKESLVRLFDLFGMDCVDMINPGNNTSLVGSFKRRNHA